MKTTRSSANLASALPKPWFNDGIKSSLLDVVTIITIDPAQMLGFADGIGAYSRSAMRPMFSVVLGRPQQFHSSGQYGKRRMSLRTQAFASCLLSQEGRNSSTQISRFFRRQSRHQQVVMDGSGCRARCPSLN